MTAKFSISILLFSLRFALSVQNFFGKLVKSSSDVIFCYHDVTTDGWEFSVTKHQFENHIKFLRAHAQIVPLSVLLSTPNTSGMPRVAVTFDDGFDGVYLHAYPILRKYDYPGTVFVLGNRNTNPKYHLRSKLMNSAKIKNLAKAGWEIGWHTDSHPNVTLLSGYQLTNELTTQKNNYEKKTGLKLRYFAYPYGKYNSKSIAAVGASGFAAAFTVDGNHIASHQSKFKFSRITVSKYISESELGALLTPLGILVNRLFTTVWKIKDNL